MKISHIILGATLALSGCSGEKEKVQIEKTTKANAQMIATLLQKYPKGQIFTRPGEAGMAILKTNPAFLETTVVTKNNTKINLKDTNADGRVDFCISEDYSTDRKNTFKDTNLDGEIDYSKTEILSAGQLIMEILDTNGDGHPDKLIAPTIGETNLYDASELELEIKTQNAEQSKIQDDLLHTILTKLK